MDALSLAAGVVALVAATAAPVDAVAQWHPLIVEAAQRCIVPEAWIVRVMRAESGGLTELGGRPIRSPKGAIGLMQLMPATWEAMRARLGLGGDPDDPRDNIMGGACYLRLMYDRFGYPGLFGAYNAGPARYAAWLAGRQALPAETVAYLGRVGGGREGLLPGNVRPRPPLLFAVRRAPLGTSAAAAEPPAQEGLFAIRTGTP